MRQEHKVALTPELARTLDAIRVAGAEGRRWPDALDEIAQYLGARFACLIFEDTDSAILELKYSTRAEKCWIIEYLRLHRRLDADKAQLLKSVGTGTVIAAHDFVSPARFKRSDEYGRWLAPHGVADIIGAILHRSEGGACLFVALLDKTANAETRDRLAALMSHLSVAVSGVEPAPDTNEMLLELFERFAAPIIIVSKDMRIIFANPAAKEELHSKSEFATVGGTLVITDPQAQEILTQIVGGHTRSSHTAAILVREGSVRCCVIHTLPLSGGGTAIISGSLEPELSKDIVVAANVYGLTARERSVLLAIAEVGGVPATARALGLTEGTVRGYLKSIFRKTGARRQADLVKLALALKFPFRSTERVVEPKVTRNDHERSG